MIEKGDVVTVRIPYPSIASGLAYRSHMYICLEYSEGTYKLAKCQTDKPELDDVMEHWVVEESNPERNPFRRRTRVDCDKLFEITDAIIPDSLKASKGISNVVLAAIETEYSSTAPEIINIDTTELLQLNSEIQQMQSEVEQTSPDVNEVHDEIAEPL